MSLPRTRILAALTLLGLGQGLAADPSPLEELLTYQCARDVASLINVNEQTGPLFSLENLVFTSVNTQSASPLLIVNAGAGTFSLPLEHSGVNRIRFELPTGQTAKAETFFMSYMHDSSAHSRVFDFSNRRAPMGKEILDYRLVQPHRAPDLLAHLEYAIWATSAAALTAVSEGSVRASAKSPSAVDCDYLEQKAPPISRSLHYNLVALETRAAHVVNTSRLPASLLSH